MSIINDALKKAQSNLKKKETEHIPNIYEKLYKPKEISPPSSEFIEPPPQEQKAWYSGILTLITIFFLVIGFLSAVLFFLLNQSTTKTQTVVVQPEDSNESTITPSPAAATPAKRLYKRNELVLSGIMMMGDKRVALINNDIYELGETVQGKKIIDITLDKVELQDGNRTIVLQVRKKP